MKMQECFGINTIQFYFIPPEYPSLPFVAPGLCQIVSWMSGTSAEMEKQNAESGDKVSENQDGELCREQSRSERTDIYASGIEADTLNTDNLGLVASTSSEMKTSQQIPEPRSRLDEVICDSLNCNSETFDPCVIKQETEYSVEKKETLKIDPDVPLKAAYDEETEEYQCNDHGKDYQYFCKKHEIQICGDCLIKIHFFCVSDRLVSTIEEYTDELRKDCSQLAEELIKQRDLTLKLMREREDHRTHVHRKCADFQGQIHEYRERINRIMDKKESAVLKEVACINDEEEFAYSDFIDSAIDVQGKLSSLILDLEKSKTKSNTQLTLDLMKGKMCKRDSLDKIVEYANDVKAFDLQCIQRLDVKTMLEKTPIFGEISKLILTGGDLFECLSEAARWIPGLSATAADLECSSDVSDTCTASDFERSSDVLDTVTQTSSIQQSGGYNDDSDIYATVSDNDTSLYKNKQPKDKKILTDAQTGQNVKGIYMETRVDILSVLEVPNSLSDSDITVLSDGRIVMSANDINTLYVLGGDGKLTFSSQYFKQPRGITEFEDNIIALTSSAGVFRLEVNASSISQVQKLLDGKFYSVSYSNGKFALCGYNYVLITSADGEQVSKIHQFGRIIKSKLYKPRHASMDVTGKYVYISDEGTQKIICSTVKGTKKWESRIRYGIPGGIVSRKNIYVAVLHLSNIVKMSLSGEELALYNIGMDPLALHITADESLFINGQEFVEGKFLIKIAKISMSTGDHSF